MPHADLSGRWSGRFNIACPNGETKQATALLVLKQSGTVITGTVGPTEDEQFAIQMGEIALDKLTLEVERDGHTIRFDLVWAGDRITGEANLPGESSAKARLDLVRMK